MTLIDIQITASTYKQSYSLNIWLCWCVFSEISGYSVSHLHWKNMESFWCWVTNYRHLTFTEQDFDLLSEKNIVGGQVSRRYESSVSSYILFYPETVSRMCRARSTLLFHLFPVQLHLLKCLCLCVSSFLSLWSVKEYMKKKKKRSRWGVWKNLKERGRGPFNLEISKTHLICSDLRCFHLFAVHIVFRFRKEVALYAMFSFLQSNL